MKVNWKLRLKNKATLISLLILIVGLIYQILSFFNVVPKISEAVTTNIIMVIVNILVAVGVVVDPTTPGLKDREEVLKDNKPKKIKPKEEED